MSLGYTLHSQRLITGVVRVIVLDTLLISSLISNVARDLCFERAALNIMALSCVHRENKIDYDIAAIEVKPPLITLVKSDHLGKM